VGITSAFIAAKYENVTSPDLEEFSKITGGIFQKSDILDMEGKILLSLDFNLTVASPLTFFDRYARLVE